MSAFDFLKKDFVMDYTYQKSMLERISIYEICDIILFQILCSIEIIQWSSSKNKEYLEAIVCYEIPNIGAYFDHMVFS